MKKYYYEGSEISTPFSIESNRPIFLNELVSLKQDRVAQEAQRWELSFNVIGTGDEAVEQLLGSILETDESKKMVMPQLNSVLDRAPATVSAADLNITAQAAAGASALTMASTGGSALVLPRGSFIRFKNVHPKLYIVTKDYTKSSTSLEIFPPLKKAVPSGTTVATFDDVELTYYRDESNFQGITYSDGVLINTGTIRLIEDI